MALLRNAFGLLCFILSLVYLVPGSYNLTLYSLHLGTVCYDQGIDGFVVLAAAE